MAVNLSKEVTSMFAELALLQATNLMHVSRSEREIWMVKQLIRANQLFMENRLGSSTELPNVQFEFPEGEGPLAEIFCVKPGVQLGDLLFRSIKDTELSIGITNALEYRDIKVVHQLVVMTETEVLKTKNLGRKKLREIRNVLAGMGLTLGMTLRIIAYDSKSAPVKSP
ncbi:MAG: DNA-directed RNA polymerase subunit alpha C-terminal domain-containing protein [bacterium]